MRENRIPADWTGLVPIISQRDRPATPTQRSSSARRALALTGLGLALIIALAITTLATLAALRDPSGPFNALRRQPSATPPLATVTPVPAFVCANAPNTRGTYVYVGGDKQLYRVDDCANPAPLGATASTTELHPLAFSPRNQWLMASIGPAAPSSDQPAIFCQVLVDPRSGALTRTTLCEDTGLTPDPAKEMPRFVGWLDESSFIEAIFTTPTTFSGPVRIVKVSVPALTQTPIATIQWVANLATGDSVGMKLRGKALYYGGFRSITEGGAWLHRLSLLDGSETKLVKLGVNGTGGCQVYSGPCAWTGPWDVSSDGTMLAYHNPGPSQSLSDTSNEPGAPLYVAKADGSGATKVMDATPDAGFTVPFFSPTGALLLSKSLNGPQGNAIVALASHAVTRVPDGSFAVRWRPDGQALLLNGAGVENNNALLYDLATKQTTRLPGLADAYVWAN